MTVTAGDAHRAAARARAIDQPAFVTVLDDARISALAESAGDGPLAGMPVVVKDNMDLAGVPTTVGCPTRTAPATAHAAVVDRLLGAGAIPVAKANMDQFATGLAGTRSPYGACHSIDSAAHVSGGSSSGSAIAVAAGIVPLSLGTDTAGSGRVPAAFNGLVGLKPTCGLLSTTGVFPASPSLDCVSVFTRDVALARTALTVLAGHDPADPWSRAAPAVTPPGIARRMGVIGVPAGPLDLDEPHRAAWEAALARAATVAHLVAVDVEPFLEAGRLLYGGPFLAERLTAFGALLTPDGPHLDPTVRALVLGARDVDGAAAFAGIEQLRRLRGLTAPTWLGIDALLLPVTPGHPTLAQLAADPIGANGPLGTYTTMVNLLDLCAVAVPAGRRPDGLPFGVQLVAPAFADAPLLDLASRWTGEPVDDAPLPARRALVAVAGPHLSGQPRNGELIAAGGSLYRRTRTAAGYRMYDVPGPLPRPGLVRAPTGGGAELEVELWDLPLQGLAELLLTVVAPLALGQVELADGAVVPGIVADASAADPTRDITAHGGWRAYLRARGA